MVVLFVLKNAIIFVSEYGTMIREIISFRKIKKEKNLARTEISFLLTSHFFKKNPVLIIIKTA